MLYSDLIQRDLEQKADITQVDVRSTEVHEVMEQDRLQRALQAALRRVPSPREMRRAWLAWAADNDKGER